MINFSTLYHYLSKNYIDTLIVGYSEAE